MRRQIDSLLYVLPKLKDSARVDCLMRLAGIYDAVFADKKSWDSSYKCTVEAYHLSKQLGYKKGLGFSYIQLASEKTLNIGDYIYNSKLVDSAVLRLMIDSCEYFSKQAILLGEALSSNEILGAAYWGLSELVYSRNSWELNEKEKDIVERYLKRAASYFEKTDDQISLGCVYRDLFYIYQEKHNNKLTVEYLEKALSQFQKAGDDRMLGDFHFFNLSRFHRDKKDKAAEENDLKRAVYYYEKVEETQKLSLVYFTLSSFYNGRSNSREAEDVLKRGISFFQKTGDLNGENSLTISLSWYYTSTGDFEKGIPVCEKSIKLTEKLSSDSSSKNTIWGVPYFYMSRFYRYAGDYETSLAYLRMARRWYSEARGEVGNWSAEVGDIHRIMRNYDSAMYYLKPFDTVRRIASKSFGITNLANLYIDLKEYDKAIPLIKSSIEIVSKTNNSQNGHNYTALAKAFIGNKNYQEALKAAREGRILLNIEVHKIRLLENYEVLSQVFHSLNKNDSAYYYVRQYASLKDSILNRQFYWRLNNYKKTSEDEKKTSQINLLNKDNQLKSEKLKQEAFVKNSLIAGLAFVLLMAIFVFRVLSLKRKNEKLKLQRNLEVQQLENEKQQTELRQQATELEMQALRAQMNPHFIFNCLSSINRFIIKNETEVASDYLTRFSRLIRMVLTNSQKTVISLQDELEMLCLYLDMERLRFKNSFDYNVHFRNVIDTGAISIPPLLLQPFCENAIWHGLMHKEGHGQLDISISMELNVLHCEITDNGIGRQKAAEFGSRSVEKEKSLGLKITKERLTLFNKNNGAETFYEIEDLYDVNNEAAGTKVKLQILCKEAVEEFKTQS